MVIGLGCGLSVQGCDSPTEVSPSERLARSSEHFLFVSTTEDASEAEMDEAMVRGELLFGRIAEFVGHQPEETIRVVFEGDQTSRGSYVDFDGMHLYRYPDADGGYWAVIAHEMVHAFAVEWFIAHSAWDWPSYRFFDEGFAEYVAQEVDPGKTGFPFYGCEEDVVAGQWLTIPGAMIPQSTLRSRHAQLNDRCNLQAYSLRASWFRYVDDTYGRSALLRMVYPEVEPTTDLVEEITGDGLPKIDREWESWIRSRYAAHPDTVEVGQAYANRTSWYDLCLEGEEF